MAVHRSAGRLRTRFSDRPAPFGAQGVGQALHRLQKSVRIRTLRHHTPPHLPALRWRTRLVPWAWTSQGICIVALSRFGCNGGWFAGAASRSASARRGSCAESPLTPPSEVMRTPRGFRCTFGRGTSAVSLSLDCSGLITRWTVPSHHGVMASVASDAGPGRRPRAGLPAFAAAVGRAGGKRPDTQGLSALVHGPGSGAASPAAVGCRFQRRGSGSVWSASFRVLRKATTSAMSRSLARYWPLKGRPVAKLPW